MPTMKGKVLLGWMSKEEAVKFLMEECVFEPPLVNNEAAQGLWETYKKRVDELPPVNLSVPARLKLSTHEKLLANKIMKLKKKANNAHIKDAWKIDPRRLTVHQLVVVEDVAGKYEPKMDDPKTRAKACLGLGSPKPAWTATNQGQTLVIDLPHGEFNLGYDPATKQFQVQETARWIAVHNYGGRMLLWAGYHRSYAVLSSQTYPEDTDRVLLAVETTEAERLLGLNSDFPTRRDALLSERPPLLSDFFDDNLCMTVNLRTGHWRFEVDKTTLHAKRVWIHD